MEALDYLVLSKLAYVDFRASDKGNSIGSVLDKVKNNVGGEARKGLDINDLELSPLLNPSNPLRSYKLINFEKNDITGFAAAAFQSPSGEKYSLFVARKLQRMVYLYGMTRLPTL